MSDEIPANVQDYLDAYLAEIDRQIPDRVIAFYLHGSVALGAYQHGLSDIDFITVLNRPATEADIACLTDIHHRIKQEYPESQLSGSYLQIQDLGKYEAKMSAHPCYQDAVLNPSGYHDINAVTWWLLKHHGIALRGTAPQDLEFSVDWDMLIADMHINLNSYWRQFTVRPIRILWLFNDYGIQWVILGVLQQYYSFREGDIVSKVAAGEYALKNLAPRWHRIVQEALHIRNRTRKSLYRSSILRAIEARAFIKYIIQICNEDYDLHD